eukprot:CAMPEP_0203882456 /NCGR_PEP_ID=MMETSP0359-20131031/26674_1 /ASSEMBLY_ACC=CAM_ASM_000338 /TAXON_ID=268821 /ORGANISM="Scrippsiella Hangoei, Strain SHTV-5" /LENGTH=122 /DNA_ID=CAMNT_0050802505 /DNA_START=42 /DNA_END=410 /DNA_ORIENTATION=-
MSLATSLSRTRGDIKHPQEAEIDAWVSEQVDTVFKPTCEAALSKGASFVHCTISACAFTHTRAWCMSPDLVEHQAVSDEITKCFRVKIAALGFATCEVVEAGRGAGGWTWSLKASWPRVPKR